MSVVTAFAATTVLAVVVAVLLVGRALVAAHVAQSAADLSALAGAHALRTGTDACAEAAGVAASNEAVVTSCTVDDRDVVIRAEVGVDLGIFGARPASAVARAGPL